MFRSVETSDTQAVGGACGALCSLLLLCCSLWWLGPSAAFAQVCIGDCDSDLVVGIDELVTGVGVALGTRSLLDCASLGADTNGRVEIDHLVSAVASSIDGCPNAVLVRGVCMRPGSSGLEPCAPGTQVMAARCDDRASCLGSPSGLTTLSFGLIGANGSFTLMLDRNETGTAPLVFEAEVEPASETTYHTMSFGLLAGGSGAGLSELEVVIDPITEAAVRLLDENGLENFDDEGAQAVIVAVRMANAETDFAGSTIPGAADLATTTAREDPEVIEVIETRATPSPTPTATPTPVPESARLGMEFQVNSYTYDYQIRSAIAAEAGGGFVVVWQSTGQDGDRTGVFGQRFDSSGSSVGAQFQVNSCTLSFQDYPAIAVEAGGGFVVVWESNGQDGDGYGVSGQRFDSSGSRVGAEFQVNSHAYGDQEYPAIAAEAGGGFVVVWQSRGQDSDSAGVFGQRFDSSGSTVGAEFRVNSYTYGNQDESVIAAEAGGGFVVVWHSQYQDGDSSGVFGQRFDSFGSRVGAEFQVNSYTYDFQLRPAIAAQAGGGFVVVWDSSYQDGDGNSSGVFGQRFDSSGSRVGAEFQVNSYTYGSQDDSSIAAEADGGFVVVWESGQDDYGDEVFGQRFDSFGSRVGAEFHVNSYTYGYQGFPTIAAEAGGGFVVVWDIIYQDADVFGQRFRQEP